MNHTRQICKWNTHQEADVRNKQWGVTGAVYSQDRNLFISTQMIVTSLQMTCCSLFIACVCAAHYRLPRAGSSIPHWWVGAPVSWTGERLCAVRPRRAGRGKSGRRQCDRWTWWRAYGWTSHSGFLERSGRRCTAVGKEGRWRCTWGALLPSGASSSLGTHRTTEMPTVADSWVEQQTDKEKQIWPK